MDSQAFVEWFSSLSPSGKITALVRIYSNLTVGAREFFLPEWKGKEQRVLEILRGLNELHHTLSNQLVQYLTNSEYAYSADGFGRMLLEIVNQYRLGSLLDSAIKFARIRSPLPNT